MGALTAPGTQAAAEALVGALQAPCSACDRGPLRELLGAVQHVGLALSVGQGHLLCTDNVLAAGCAAQPSLRPLSGTLVAVVMRHGAKLVKHTDHNLEDVQAIMAASGCTAVVCVPLSAGDSTAGASTGCQAGDGQQQRQQQQQQQCLGALTVGFASASHISGAALKGALLLAYALATEQRAALTELAGLVASMLLPPPPAGAPADGDASDGSEGGWSGSELDFGAGWDRSTSGGDDGDLSTSGSEDEGGAPPRASPGVPQPGGRRSPGAALSPRDCGAPPHSRALLSYADPGLEARFARYHARHMQGVDCWAYAITCLFYLIEMFLPGTPFRLVQKMGWRCLVGMGGILPGAPLLFERGRPWFAARRELLLGASWLWTLGFMSGVVCNYLHILDRAAFRHPLYLQSFGWLSVVGLAFQLRFRWQALVVSLAYCVNTQLLPAICARHYDELPPARCVALGLLRVALHGVALPLACCYAFEAHARRLFWRAQRRRARDA